MTTATSTTLAAAFSRLLDPSADPDAAVRTKLRTFVSAYLNEKGSEGGFLEEGETRLSEVVERDPRAWPRDWPRLKELFIEVWSDPERLPPISPRAQLLWLGIELDVPFEAVKAAVRRAFPVTTPRELLDAYREASDHRGKELAAAKMQTAIFEAWHDIQVARGRAEEELVFGNCVRDLDVVEQRDGGQFLNFNRLQLVADPELRQATIAAAWAASEKAKRD